MLLGRCSNVVGGHDLRPGRRWQLGALAEAGTVGAARLRTRCNAIDFWIRAEQEDLVPVRAMLTWCRQSGRPHRGPVSDSSPQDTRTALQQRSARAFGGRPRLNGLHLLRAGVATVVEPGRPVNEIDFLGRWQSAVVLQYTGTGEQLAAESSLPQAGVRGLFA